MFVVLFVLAACGGEKKTSSTGKIEGTVFLDSTSNKKPLASVSVSALNADTFQEVSSTTTDTQGLFSFDLQPGRYILSAAVPGDCVVIDMPHVIDLQKGKVAKQDVSLPCSP